MTLEEMRRRKAELGLTNEMLAEASGVPLGTVQKIMSGRSKSPRYDNLKRLEGTLRERDTWYMDEIVSPGELPESDNIIQRLARQALPPELRSDRQNEGTGKEDMLRDGGAAAAYGRQKKPGEYTVKDYWALPKERRAELIDGVFYDLATPKGAHQAVALFIAYSLMSFTLKNGRPCRVEIAPRSVRLDMDDKTMVEPDVMVVCDPGKDHNYYVDGAPDLVIEVLSPSTAKKDLMLKPRKYAKAGVREYWIVDPEGLQVMVLDYEHKAPAAFYDFDSKVPVAIWDGKCMIDFSGIKEEVLFYIRQPR